MKIRENCEIYQCQIQKEINSESVLPALPQTLPALSPDWETPLRCVQDCHTCAGGCKCFSTSALGLKDLPAREESPRCPMQPDHGHVLAPAVCRSAERCAGGVKALLQEISSEAEPSCILVPSLWEISETICEWPARFTSAMVSYIQTK